LRQLGDLHAALAAFQRTIDAITLHEGSMDQLAQLAHLLRRNCVSQASSATRSSSASCSASGAIA